MTLYFTADQHFYHANIIKYCNRPFPDVRTMNKIIIERHNEEVGPDDTVIMLGDFGLASRERLEKIVEQLNGHKHLVLGNHDCYKPWSYIDMGFESVHTLLLLGPSTPLIKCPIPLVAVHDPAVATVSRETLFLVGHIHQLFKHTGNAINVGVDVWDFKPVSIATLASEFRLQETNKTKADNILGEIDYIIQDKDDETAQAIAKSLKAYYGSSRHVDYATTTDMYDQ